MKNPLAIFNSKVGNNQDIKQRVLKNREAVLDVLSDSIEGAKGCEKLLGQKCLGKFCEKFMNFKNIDEEGKEISYWRCADVQLPLLVIETNQRLMENNRLLERLIEILEKK
jgi:hypothetical protein